MQVEAGIFALFMAGTADADRPTADGSDGEAVAVPFGSLLELLSIAGAEASLPDKGCAVYMPIASVVEEAKGATEDNPATQTTVDEGTLAPFMQDRLFGQPHSALFTQAVIVEPRAQQKAPSGAKEAGTTVALSSPDMDGTDRVAHSLLAFSQKDAKGLSTGISRHNTAGADNRGVATVDALEEIAIETDKEDNGMAVIKEGAKKDVVELTASDVKPQDIQAHSRFAIDGMGQREPASEKSLDVQADSGRQAKESAFVAEAQSHRGEDRKDGGDGSRPWGHNRQSIQPVTAGIAVEQPQFESLIKVEGVEQSPQPVNSIEELKEEVFGRLQGYLSRIELKQGKAEARLVLNPPELGRMHIEIEVVDSKVETRIVVEQGVVKDVLTADVARLKDMFIQQGLTLERYTVETAAGWTTNREGPRQGQRQGDGQRHGSYRAAGRATTMDGTTGINEKVVPQESGGISLFA